MAEKMYLLPASMRDALLAYLGARPFSEVNGGYQGLAALPEQAASEPAVKLPFERVAPTDYQKKCIESSAWPRDQQMALIWAPDNLLAVLGYDHSPGADNGRD